MSAPERGRLQAPGHRVDDGSHHTLVLVEEADRAWTVHRLGAALRLEPDVMVEVCRSVLKRATAHRAPDPGSREGGVDGAGGPWRWYLRDPCDLVDAHLATECPACGVVKARCGAVFEPAAVANFGARSLEPPDPRACAECQARQVDAP